MRAQIFGWPAPQQFEIAKKRAKFGAIWTTSNFDCEYLWNESTYQNKKFELMLTRRAKAYSSSC